MNSVSGILKKNHFVEHLQVAAISQTSLKYVLVGNVTLAKKETQSVTMQGSNDLE